MPTYCYIDCEHQTNLRQKIEDSNLGSVVTVISSFPKEWTVSFKIITTFIAKFKHWDTEYAMTIITLIAKVHHLFKLTITWILQKCKK